MCRYDPYRVTEILHVPRAVFDIEDPWTAPAVCTPVRLRRATDGAVPRLATRLAVWFDAEHLTVLFSASDDHVQATHYAHDAPLYEQDVVEVFLAPDDLTRYFELEVNPVGTTFDALIDSPNGIRDGLRADRGWTCEGMWAAVRTLTDSGGAITIDTIVRIPFSALGRSLPADGETWRGNFFRIDRHPRHGDEFSAWQPTLKQPADFHVAAAFGTLRFTV